MKLMVLGVLGQMGLLLTFLLLLSASTVYARDDATLPKQAPSQYSDLKQTVQAALQAEKKNLSSIEKSLRDHEKRSGDLIARNGETRQGFINLTQKFTSEIQEEKRSDLFQRTVNPLIGLGWKNIVGELRLMVEQFRKIGSLEHWLALWTDLLASRGLLPVTSVLLYLLTLMLIVRLRRFCRQLKEMPFCTEYPWRRMAIRLFTRSMPLLGTALFVYILSHARGLFDTIPGIQQTFFLLIVWIFTKWGLNFITLQSQQERQLLPTAWAPRLKQLLRLIRFFAVVYLVLTWLVGSEGILPMVARITFEAALVVWIFRFRPTFRAHSMPAVAPEIWQKLLRPSLSVLAHIIFITGPVLELAGYGALSLYWFTSWGATTVALFWGLLFFLILREGGQRFYKGSPTSSAAPYRSAQPIRWAGLQLCWLLWGILLIITVVLAWSGTQTVFSGLAKVLRFPVSVGDSIFTLMGFISAALILFFTHLLIRLWRHVLSNRILAQSGLESGLQHSMTSITVYLLWGIGVLVALHAFGLSSTSLTVAFGALGIGLGFGLQNIFNNFISGIILLFERPIQVGDSVEINGIWAEVKKIRFRSTVVQTFDNASLIIPNSEFISSQVTNWSFRDLTLRIKITVGVAYGSDIERVRSRLLEIAGRTEKVLAYPRPDVLFSDFGDSALIFVLRVWTDVDNMLKVGTAIRFEIDRVFREHNIEIAFPQRDIHIRSSVTAKASNEFTVEVEPADKKAALSQS